MSFPEAAFNWESLVSRTQEKCASSSESISALQQETIAHKQINKQINKVTINHKRLNKKLEVSFPAV